MIRCFLRTGAPLLLAGFLAVSCSTTAKIPAFEIEVSPLSQPSKGGPIQYVSVSDITVTIRSKKAFPAGTTLECVVDEESPVPCSKPWVITGLTATNHQLRVTAILGTDIALATTTVSVDQNGA